MRKPPAGLKARFLTPAVRFLLPSIHHPQAENPSPGPVSPTCCVSLCHLLRCTGLHSQPFDQFFSSNPSFLPAPICPPPFPFIIGLVAESLSFSDLTVVAPRSRINAARWSRPMAGFRLSIFGYLSFCGHSTSVVRQPSKLFRRVRLPLPALFFSVQ